MHKACASTDGSPGGPRAKDLPINGASSGLKCANMEVRLLVQYAEGEGVKSSGVGVFAAPPAGKSLSTCATSGYIIYTLGPDLKHGAG